ncbi:MAG: ribonuclease domain-containing protein [bacterium]
MKHTKLLALLLALALLLTGCELLLAPETTAEPEPTVTEPAPTITEPSTVETEPEPAITEPGTVETEPEPAVTEPTNIEPEPEPSTLIDEDGVYDSRDEVALYLYTYGHLPSNYITKKEAEALGWPGGNLEPYAPGKCIGGSRFGNYENLLPAAEGRTWQECDIDTLGAKSRGAKRLVFSNDGLIYYTEDHYKTFTLLYGEAAE